MKNSITKVIVNGKPTRTRKLKGIVAAMIDPCILTEKGGYLFKALVRDHTCILGILPYQIDGIRTHHYELDMPQDDYLLTGFINANRTMTLLFKMTSEQLGKGLTLEEATAYRDVFIRFAQLLTEHGFPTNFELDEVTQEVFMRMGWNTPVRSIGELCSACQNTHHPQDLET